MSVESLLGGLVSDKTLESVKEIEAKHMAIPPTDKPVDPPPTDKPIDPPPTDKSVDPPPTDKPVDKPTDPPTDKPADKPVDKPELKDNPLGLKLKKEEKKTEIPVIESNEQLLEYVKKTFGQEYKDIKEIPKFFEVASKWRADAQNLEKVTKERDQYVGFLEKLPTELFSALQAYDKNEDWKKVLETQPKIDFKLPVDKHSPEALVENYFPGKFKEEDFKAEEKSDALKIAIEASTKSYNVDKTAREQRAAQEIEKAKGHTKAIQDSISGSVAHLKQSFPDVSADAETAIANAFASGDVISKFYNNDGTVKPEAARKLMMAEYGEELIVQLMEIAKHQGEGAANEGLLERSSEKKPPGNSGSGDKVKKEVTDMIDELLPKGLTQKNTYG